MDIDKQIHKWSALKLAPEGQSPEQRELNRKERIWHLSRLNKARDEGRALQPGPTVWDEIRMREERDKAFRMLEELKKKGIDFSDPRNEDLRRVMEMNRISDKLTPEQLKFLKERIEYIKPIDFSE